MNQANLVFDISCSICESLQNSEWSSSNRPVSLLHTASLKSNSVKETGFSLILLRASLSSLYLLSRRRVCLFGSWVGLYLIIPLGTYTRSIRSNRRSTLPLHCKYIDRRRVWFKPNFDRNNESKSVEKYLKYLSNPINLKQLVQTLISYPNEISSRDTTDIRYPRTLTL